MTFGVDSDGNIVVEDITSVLQIYGTFYTNLFTADTIEITATPVVSGTVIRQDISLNPPASPSRCDSISAAKEKDICRYAENEIIPEGYPQALVDTTMGGVTTDKPWLDMANLPGDVTNRSFLRYDKSKYQLIFNDEFDGSDITEELNPVWRLHFIDKVSPTRPNAPCSLSLENGYLKFQAEEYETNKWCLLAFINTQGSFEFRYGYIEIQYKVQLPMLHARNAERDHMSSYLNSARHLVFSTYADSRFMWGTGPQFRAAHPMFRHLRSDSNENSLRMIGAELDFSEVIRERNWGQLNLFLEEFNIYVRRRPRTNLSNLRRVRGVASGETWPDVHCAYENKRGILMDFAHDNCRYDPVSASSTTYNPPNQPPLSDVVEHTFRLATEWRPDGYSIGRNDMGNTNDPTSISRRLHVNGDNTETYGNSGTHVSHVATFLIANGWTSGGSRGLGKIGGNRYLVHNSNPVLANQIWKIDYIRVYQPRNKYSDVMPSYAIR